VRAPTLLAALLAALVLAACGAGADATGDFEGTEADVAQVLEDLQTAAQEDEPGRVCRNLLATTFVRSLGEAGVDCRRAVTLALDDADGFDLEVRDISVNGTQATARVASGTGESAEQGTVRLVREGDNWRIADIAMQ
jgi:hypothetical protein